MEAGLKEPFQPASQTLSRRLAQVNYLLPRQIEQSGDRRVVERQVWPHLGESFCGDFERLGDLPQRCDAGSRKEGQASAPVRLAQIEEKGRALRARQLAHLLPESFEEDALL